MLAMQNSGPLQDKVYTWQEPPSGASYAEQRANKTAIVPDLTAGWGGAQQPTWRVGLRQGCGIQGWQRKVP